MAVVFSKMFANNNICSTRRVWKLSSTDLLFSPFYFSLPNFLSVETLINYIYVY